MNKSTTLKISVCFFIFFFLTVFYFLLNPLKSSDKIISSHTFNYYVWDTEVISADEHQGLNMQIAEIRGSSLYTLNLPKERQLADELWEEQKPIASSNLGLSAAATEDLAQDVGYKNEIKSSYPLKLNSLFEGPLFEIQPAAYKEQAILHVHLKKRCPVTVIIKEKIQWRNRTMGIWSLPYRYTRDVLEIKKPECYDPGDKQIIINNI